MVDLLLPLGSGSPFGNNELMFFIRSLRRYGTGWRTLWIAGEDPGFLRQDDRVRFVPIPEPTHPKEFRIIWKQLYAMERIPEMLDDVVLVNDDYVLCAPVDLSTIPAYRKSGSLRDHAASHPCPVYSATLAASYRFLSTRGKPTRHFDVHLPCRVSRDAYLRLRPVWNDATRSEGKHDGVVCRSVYHNWYRTPGEIVNDLKFSDKNSHRIRELTAGRWVFSYGDTAIPAGMGAFLSAEFPEPSPWETA